MCDKYTVLLYCQPASLRQEWKEVLPEHLLPGGLDVRFDLDGGRNFARRLVPFSEDYG